MYHLVDTFSYDAVMKEKSLRTGTVAVQIFVLRSHHCFWISDQFVHTSSSDLEGKEVNFFKAFILIEGNVLLLHMRYIFNLVLFNECKTAVFSIAFPWYRMKVRYSSNDAILTLSCYIICVWDGMCQLLLQCFSYEVLRIKEFFRSIPLTQQCYQ